MQRRGLQVPDMPVVTVPHPNAIKTDSELAGVAGQFVAEAMGGLLARKPGAA